MKRIRFLSGCAAVVLAITGLGGCSKDEPKDETGIISPTENLAAVYIYEDNAVIFQKGYNVGGNDASVYIFEDISDLKEKEKFYGKNILCIKYKDKDELEDKIEAFIGEDGNLTYYDEIGKSKTLS